VEADAVSLSSKAADWDAYSAAYVMAGELVSAGKSLRAAADEASAKYNVKLSYSSARRAAAQVGEPPAKGGKALMIPVDIEYKLEDLCLALREMQLPIFRFMVLNYVNKLLEGTTLQQQLKHKEVRRHWYYNWLSRCSRLKTANIRPLEITRAKWATPENVKHHYEMLAELLIQTGIGVSVPCDLNIPYAESLKIIKPEMLASMDETRLTNDTTEKNKSKANRSLVGSHGDSREVVVNKGGGDGTGIGGSTADGKDLPGFFIFSKDIIHSADVAREKIPVCRRMSVADPTEPIPARFWSNAKGGVTGDLGVRYIRGIIEPAMPGLSPSSPGVSPPIAPHPHPHPHPHPAPAHHTYPPSLCALSLLMRTLP
jgi:hypothetical protein